MGLFGAQKVDPKKQVNEMNGQLRRETRAIDRQIQTIEREQNKTKLEIKKAAKKGDRDVCKILAKEIVNSKRAVSKLYQSKAQVNSVMVSVEILRPYFSWLQKIVNLELALWTAILGLGQRCIRTKINYVYKDNVKLVVYEDICMTITYSL